MVKQRAARVLLVEDDDGDALLVCEMLADVAPELEILREQSLAGAGRRLARDSVGCVLLDLDLPDAIGLEALGALRGAGVPIIVLTGHDDEQRGISSLGAGAQEYLVKGRVDGPLLRRAMRYAIERSRAEAGARELLEARLQARENTRLERGLLPTAILRDPAIGVSTTYRPGRRRALLGGDFFDAVELPDRSVLVIIGDVAGHGPDEAALGVCLRIAWRALVLAERPLEEVLAVLDQVLVHERHDEAVFATAALVRLRPDRRWADLYSAGHPPPMLLGDNGSPVLVEPAVRHPPLGVPSREPWRATPVALGAASSLLLYTDGLIEGRIAQGDARLEVEGLVALLAGAGWTPGDAGRDRRLLTTIVDEVERLNGGDLTDDLAAVLLSWR